MHAYPETYAFNIAIAHPADLGRFICGHGLVSLFFASCLWVGSRPGAYARGVTLGAALAELFFQPAASLRRSGGNRIVVAAGARRFQFADTRCILVRQCGISMARSAALAPHHRACASGIRGLCSSPVTLRCRGVTEPATAAGHRRRCFCGLRRAALLENFNPCVPVENKRKPPIIVVIPRAVNEQALSSACA